LSNLITFNVAPPFPAENVVSVVVQSEVENVLKPYSLKRKEKLTCLNQVKRF
jgi:hypothetical protein